MFIVALIAGLVVGVVSSAMLLARLRLRLNFALIAFLIGVLILLSLPAPHELTIGLAAGMLLGFLIVQIRPQASGSKPPVDL
jgi:hypothetical protein